MTTRKSSLRLDRTQQIKDIYKNIEMPRQRKNSAGVNRTALEQIHTNDNIGFDEKFTNKIILAKRIQKYQKDAIKYFYEQKNQDCFNALQKCIDLLEQCNFSNQSSFGLKQQFIFPEHMVYVRYLQCEFKFKLKKFSESREFYCKIEKMYNKIMKEITKKNQKQKTNQYFTSLQSLNALLLFEEEKYADSVQAIQQIELKIQTKAIKLSEKNIKQLQICRIEALDHLKQYQLVIKLSENLNNKNLNWTLKQNYKIGTLLSFAHKKLNRIEKSEQIIISLIQNLKKQIASFDQKSSLNSNSLNELKSLLSKCYSTYATLFSQNPLKGIFICKKWCQQCENSDHAFSKLFHLFYQIGDYEQALLEFSELSDDYKKISEDWEHLADIKYFYGQIEVSRHMYLRALEISKGEQKRMSIQVKILEVCEQEKSKQLMKAFEKKIKEHKGKSWIHKIIQKYRQFLQGIGQEARFTKISTILELNDNQAQNLTKTAKFNSLLKNQQKSLKLNKKVQRI